MAVSHGIYIISILSAAQSDETRNVGFVIRYRAGPNEIKRVNTRSLTTLERPKPTDTTTTSADPPSPKTEERLLAFKALPRPTASSASGTSSLSERRQIDSVCAELQRLLRQTAADASVDVVTVQQQDIITLAEARKSTGLIEQLGHSLKKLVWA